MMKHVVCFKLKDRTQAPRAREVLLLSLIHILFT